MPLPPTNWPKRMASRLLIGLFFLIIWLPTLDTFFHLDRRLLLTENNLPATFPKYAAKPGGLKEFLTGLDTYFNDHFGFRQRLVHWHNELEASVFAAPSVLNVFIGQNGFLFYAGDQMIDNFQGVLPFTTQELRHHQLQLEQYRDWLARRGISYIFVVAPDKQSIYPEYVAPWLKPGNRRTKLDQFVDYMRDHSTVTVLDLRSALLAAKRVAPTYYKSDTHWNTFGGFVGSQEIVKALPDKSRLPSLSLDSFELKQRDFTNGDLARMLGIVAPEEDFIWAPKTNLPPLNLARYDDKSAIPWEVTTNLSTTGTCVVFGDSFREALTPFLGYHFNRVIYYFELHGFNTNAVNTIKPDVVITEVVERHLDFNLLFKD